MKKKIIFVNHASSFNGGAEKSLLEMVSALQESEEYLIKVVLPEDGDLLTKIKEKNIAYSLVKEESWRMWHKNYFQILKFFLTFIKLFFNLYDWIVFLKKEKADILHININRLIIPLLASKMIGLKTIIHFRDVPNQTRYKFVFGWDLYYYIMNLGKIWIANSLYTHSQINSKSNAPKIDVLYNYLDFKLFDDKLSRSASSNSILKKEFSVVMLGGINPWKNQIEFVNVAIRVLKKRKDIFFYMFGKIISKEYYEKLMKKIHDEKCDKNIFFRGHEKNVEKIFLESDLMLHTSLVEPFGRVFIESLAAGVPLIASGNGGAKEIVNNGIHGYVFNNWDTKTVANKVIFLKENEEVRNKMGLSGRSLVKDKFSKSIFVNKLRNIYSNVLNSQDILRK